MVVGGGRCDGWSVWLFLELLLSHCVVVDWKKGYDRVGQIGSVAHFLSSSPAGASVASIPPKKRFFVSFFFSFFVVAAPKHLTRSGRRGKRID